MEVKLVNSMIHNFFFEYRKYEGICEKAEDVALGHTAQMTEW